MKKLNKKGFTLAELLIVIAIIAILIAIAIPVFTSQLRAARLSTDHANIRSAYAWAQSANLMGQADIDGNGTIDATEKPGGSLLVKDATVKFGRDGKISNSVASPYTLMVTTDPATECLESAPCSTSYKPSDFTFTSKHEQDNEIHIKYLESTGTSKSYQWFVVMEKDSTGSP